VALARARPNQLIRVAAVDHSALVREGLSAILAAETRIELIGVCADWQELEPLIATRRPDVVVTDLPSAPLATDKRALSIVPRLRARDPEIGIVVLANDADPEVLVELLGQGCAGTAYLVKDRIGDVGQLVRAITAVRDGDSAIDPGLVDALINARGHESLSPLAELTSREHEILGQIAKGMSNRAIAESCVLTKRAVEKHINSIFAKLRLRDSRAVSRRVKAALLFLADDAGGQVPPAERSPQPPITLPHKSLGRSGSSRPDAALGAPAPAPRRSPSTKAAA